MKDEIFTTKLGKLYVKGLMIAVDAGATSASVLQKKLNIDYQSARQMLNWMIEKGFVKDDSGNDGLKTTLMSEEELNSLIAELGYSFKTKRERQSIISDDLYKACLRLAAKRGKICCDMFMEAFMIGRQRAQAVVERMREDGLDMSFSRTAFLENRHSCDRLAVSKKFKELYGEEI